MRSYTPRDMNGLCRQCFMREPWCLCELVPRIETEVHFVIVRNFKEAYKTSNSGRLAAMALSNCTLMDFGAVDSNYNPSVLEGESVWLMYPSTGGAPGLGGKEEFPKPDKLVILDATWRQARRMSQRMEAVRMLPRLSLWPASMETDRIRQKPHDWTMATIEAIARAVETFEGAEKAKQLDELFERMVLHYRAMKRSISVERYLAELEREKVGTEGGD